MKSIIILIALVAFALIPFGGCKKSDDLTSKKDTNEVSNCRIASITGLNSLDATVHTGIVYYNDHNDPDSVIFDFEGNIGGVALFYFL